MNKIWIVIAREYLTRVKNKAFIISTLLAPLGFALLTVLPLLVAKFNEKASYSVLVKDPSQLVVKSLNSDSQFQFAETVAPVDSLKETLRKDANLILLEIPPAIDKQTVTINLYSQKSLNIQTETRLGSILKTILRDYKMVQAGIDRQKLKETEIDLSLSTIKLGEAAEEKTNSAQATMVGYGMSLLMYMLVMIYGSLVMRGVMEEKSNRIVEIIISSIEPTQFMLGKIIGIAAVGFTQFLLWCIQIFGLLFLMGLVLGVSGAGSGMEMPADQQATPEQMKMAKSIAEGMVHFKFSLLFYFVIYFIGGYLIYSSLFAAVGSAIEQESDVGQYSFVVSMPSLISIILLPGMLLNPSGVLAVVCSYIPFTSPMAMMVRLASSDVPWWEVSLSILLLIGGCIGAAWVAGRIYRVGILLYGQKPSWKAMAKWILQS